MAWIERTPAAAIFLPAIAVAELQRGIEMLRKQDPERAASFDQWLDALAATAQVVPADAKVFREWARLMVGKSSAHAEDGLIAATARVHGLTVVTRNVRDYRALEVPLLNPFVSG